MDLCGPVAQGEVAGVDDLQEAVGQHGVGGDDPLDLLHVGFILGDSHHQPKEVALQVAAVVDGGEQLLRHIAAGHGVYVHGESLTVEPLVVNSGGNALLAHAVGQLHHVADAVVGAVLKVDLDVVKLVNDGDVAGRELELIYRDLVPLLGQTLHKVHSQGVDDHAVVHLHHKVCAVEDLGGLLHQQGGGEGHKAHRAFKQLVGILGEEAVDSVRSGKLVGGRLNAAVGLILPVVQNLVADDFAVEVFDGLADNIFAVIHVDPPLL